jgi:hypothetical protein
MLDRHANAPGQGEAQRRAQGADTALRRWRREAVTDDRNLNYDPQLNG